MALVAQAVLISWQGLRRRHKAKIEAVSLSVLTYGACDSLINFVPNATHALLTASIATDSI